MVIDMNWWKNEIFEFLDIGIKRLLIKKDLIYLPIWKHPPYSLWVEIKSYYKRSGYQSILSKLMISPRFSFFLHKCTSNFGINENLSLTDQYTSAFISLNLILVFSLTYVYVSLKIWM